MADNRRQLQDESGVHLDDVLFALFKRKSTVLLCVLFGIVAAVALCLLWPASYESRAKLLVRYVLERSGVDPIEAEAPPTNTRRPICSDSERSTSSSAPSRTCTDSEALAI